MRFVSRLSAAVPAMAIAALLVAPDLAGAQGSPAGTLTGTVSDPSGGVLPGVMVIAKGAQTGLTQQTISGGAGEWRIPGLPVGTYEVSFELDGFKRLVRSGINVDAASTRSVPVTLEVGGLSETVQVSADANLLTGTTPTTARSLTSAELESVPTSTGSFTHLLSSEAGVSADLPPVLINGTGNISPSVNGTRTTSTSLFFNGIDATNLTSNEGSMSDNIAPASDMLEEVKLQTSMYDASTGRSGGGNFQLVTRSGTNEFRGAAHFTVQHEKFNSNDFFYEKDGIAKPKARRNEGGFTIGGPVRQNRFFFLRQRNVVPAEFTRDQYTLKLDGQLASNNRLSVTGFYAEFPGLDPFPDPSSLVSPFTLERADRNATIARRPQLRAALGRVQRLQHRQLRAAGERDRLRRDRLR